jgi:hypothetical protein
MLHALWLPEITMRQGQDSSSVYFIQIVYTDLTFAAHGRYIHAGRLCL